MDLNVPSKYKHDLNLAIEILKKEGCSSIYLFGSLVTGNIHDKSDIDIGVKGLPRGKFVETYAKVYNALENNVDVIDFDKNNDFYILLNKLGEVVEVG